MLRKTLPLLRSKNIWAVRCEHELALHRTTGVGKKEIYLEVFQKETNTPKQKNTSALKRILLLKSVKPYDMTERIAVIAFMDPVLVEF